MSHIEIDAQVSLDRAESFRNSSIYLLTEAVLPSPAVGDPEKGHYTRAEVLAEAKCASTPRMNT